jgi:Protein of unknown function (DUF2794)
MRNNIGTNATGERDIAKIAPVVRLADYRRAAAAVSFRRHELNLLLSLYSRRVIGGEWRDYAIDQDTRHAAFSVFRRASDRPVFTICKFAQGSHPDGDFAVYASGKPVKRARSMGETLAWFEGRLKLVSP